MKTIWQVLLGTAAVAAVTPYSVRKDQESGAIRIKSATWNATYTPATAEHEKQLQINLLPESLFRQKATEVCEDACCCGEETENGEGITVEEVDPETPQA